MYVDVDAFIFDVYGFIGIQCNIVFCELFVYIFLLPLDEHILDV